MIINYYYKGGNCTKLFFFVYSDDSLGEHPVQGLLLNFSGLILHSEFWFGVFLTKNNSKIMSWTLMHLVKAHKTSTNSQSTNPGKGVRAVNGELRVLPRGLLASSLVLPRSRHRFLVSHQRVFTDEMTPSASRY